MRSELFTFLFGLELGWILTSLPSLLLPCSSAGRISALPRAKRLALFVYPYLSTLAPWTATATLHSRPQPSAIAPSNSSPVVDRPAVPAPTPVNTALPSDCSQKARFYINLAIYAGALLTTSAVALGVAVALTLVGKVCPRSYGSCSRTLADSALPYSSAAVQYKPNRRPTLLLPRLAHDRSQAPPDAG